MRNTAIKVEPALRPSPATPDTTVALSAFRFPHGDAMSNRLLHLARSATPEGGTTVVVNDWPAQGSPPPAAPILPPGVRLITLTGSPQGRWGRWWWQWTRPWRMVRALRRHGLRPADLAGVCVPLNLWSLTTWLVLRTALRRPLTVDVCERHDAAQFPRGRWTPYFLRHRWASMLAARLADRVTTVSQTLGERFRAAGRPTLVVPPLVDPTEYARCDPPPTATGVRLLYAGTAGPKDLLAVVVSALLTLPPADRDRIELVVAGMTGAEAAHASDLDRRQLTEVGDRVTFLGRVPRDRVLAELSRSHLSVLVRPDAGYANAGFPSKVPESLAAGCPVLLNHTSDLHRYVVDGQEGIVLAGSTVADVRAGLRRAARLDDAGWRQLSLAAHNRATTDFDYRAWRSTVSTFVATGSAVPGGSTGSPDTGSVGSLEAGAGGVPGPSAARSDSSAN
ncbi:glycosyltransferase [Micromonospora sp. SH-82]|uniref:glycosyltransferase n=1 Tax=Micromonospora sp. SH-82 TaxID=3132938 RepID=UPI003EBFA8A7